MKELIKYYTYEQKNDYSNKFVLREKLKYGRQKNYFDTPEEATNHFNKSQEIAIKKYNKIMDGIEKLKEEMGDFDIYAWAHADDDSGLDYGATIEINVNEYDFIFYL